MSAVSSRPLPHIELRPKITVIGVGGAGGNAVNNMIQSQLQGVDFVICNTDAQALTQGLTDRRVQLGQQITQGLGAGARAEVGRAAAEESMEEILKQIEGSNMVFVTCGLGGGTGTGAAPVIAQAARDQGILTIAVVTKPFNFEGKHRMRTAENGLNELEQYVDTLIVIPNQNLFRMANENTTFAEAFRMADEVLHAGVRGVTDLMMLPGLINLDFADIRTVMQEMGKATMGTGEAQGDRRAIEAAETAISNPLLDDSIKGAKSVLMNIMGGLDLSLHQVDEATSRVREEVDPEANIIFGAILDESMMGKIRVSVVATGIDQEALKSKMESSAKVVTAVNRPTTTADAQNISPRGFFARKREEDVRILQREENDNDIFSANYRAPSTDAAVTSTQNNADLTVAPQVTPFQKETVEPRAVEPVASEEFTPAAKARKVGFFEMLADTVRGGGRVAQEEGGNAPQVVHPHPTPPQDVKVYTTSNNLPEQDTLETPAFLRRRV